MRIAVEVLDSIAIVGLVSIGVFNAGRSFFGELAASNLSIGIGLLVAAACAWRAAFRR